MGVSEDVMWMRVMTVASVTEQNNDFTEKN